MKAKRNGYRVWVEKLEEKKRPLGRRTWEDNIKMELRKSTMG
jgi:hypothetical protein